MLFMPVIYHRDVHKYIAFLLSTIVCCENVTVTLRASQPTPFMQSTIRACDGALVAIECEVTDCHGIEWIIPNVTNTTIYVDDTSPEFDGPIFGNITSKSRNEESTTINMTSYIFFYYDINLRNLTGEKTTVICKNPEGPQSDTIHIVSKGKNVYAHK